MTYCVAIKVKEGIVGLADSLITSGREMTNLRKVMVYSPAGGTMFVMSSGLRSLRDKTLTYFEEALSRRTEPFDRLYEAVNLVAEQLRMVSREDRESIEQGGLTFNLHALIGGQMRKDSEAKLYLLYPEGNWVDTGQLTPYHIIGSTGYGKPLLDRALKFDDSLRHAFKVGCLSFDSTRISAADVGFPIDAVICRNNSFKMDEQRFRKEDLEPISDWWQERIRRAIQELPKEWVDRAFDRLDSGGAEGAPALPLGLQIEAERQ